MAKPAEVMSAIEKKISKTVCRLRLKGSLVIAKAVSRDKPPVISQ
jgi:hypothetical protein